MTNKAKKFNPAMRLDLRHRNIVLKWIAQYRSTEWIVAELEKRYGVKRSPAVINNEYRYPSRHKAKIQQYRDVYNAQFQDEAFGSRRYALQCLKETYDMAYCQQDARAMLAVIKQACALLGFEQEYSPSCSLYGSYEETLHRILQVEESTANSLDLL